MKTKAGCFWLVSFAAVSLAQAQTTMTAAAAPEPGTFALLAVGTLALGMVVFRRRRG